MLGTAGDGESLWEEAIERLKRQAHLRELWQDDDVIVIAVSGGPDSILLMHMLHAIHATTAVDHSQRLVVAHVHHGFRQAESDAEAEMVAAEAAKLGLSCEIARVDAPGYAAEHRMNPQAAARELRYQFLRQVAHQYGATRIALAHHGDDQAETILMHLIRGAGGTGLSGIAWSREEAGLTYIRPLLYLSKEHILDLCNKCYLTYAVDSSNELRKYTRNRIRMDILPLMEEENPRVVEAMGQMAEVTREEQDWLEQATLQFCDQHVMSWGLQEVSGNQDNWRWEYTAYKKQFIGGCVLSRNIFCGVHVALQRRLIKLILNYLLPEAEQAADFSTIERIRLQARADHPTTWKTDIGHGLQFRREYDLLLFVMQERMKDSSDSQEVSSDNLFVIEPQVLSGTETVAGIMGTLSWRFLSIDEWRRSRCNSAYQAAFDADQLIWPLKIRTRRPGDRMRPQGLKGSKKVQDMFVDSKVPPSLRSSIPLVEDGAGQLLWAAGVRRSDVATVSDTTVQVWVLTLTV